MNHKPSPNYLLHYGIKRKSGRYPWGSGEDPRQHEKMFLTEYQSLKAKGLSQVEIAEKMNMNTRQLRDNITWARAHRDFENRARAHSMKADGMTNVGIGKILGVSEATVRNYLSDGNRAESIRVKQLDNIAEAIRSGVDKTGYLDVGIGVERQLGVSRTKFNAMVNKLAQEEGYHIHEVHIKRLSDNTVTDADLGVFAKYTTMKVLTKDPSKESALANKDKIRPLDSWSDDNAETLKKMRTPDLIDLKRIKVVYAEEGGADKDGLIELRPGVKDLDMGNSKYAQVRIAAGKDLYLKGMAAYSDADKFPDGVDILFNTNKEKGTPVDKVLKKMKMTPDETDDPSFIFGSSVVRQKGALNIVNEQGEWDTWSKNMSSQFLSKQPLSLIKDRLDDTYNGLRNEFQEINSLTNPVVKKYLMESYIQGLDAKANHLKAKGLPGTKNHVLMPFPDMKPNEIYAPHYKNGDRVVLVRHPHGGRFEIPDLIVNNKHAGARKMLGPDAPDAVGIHPSVANKLSGADFDGDTALVIPNNNRAIKSDRSLKELKNFEPKMYAVDHQTITKKYQQTQMGIVSNLITDMTIRGASPSELARAVKHSMVVIDAEKHKLNYKQSEIDNGISALIKKYQTHYHPETGKLTRGASTLISRSKQKVDISQHDTVRELNRDKVDRNGNVKKGMSPSEIAKKLKLSEKTVNDYLNGGTFNPDKYSSGTAQEKLYSDYIKNIQKTKVEAQKVFESIPTPQYSKEAARLYAPEVKSLNVKLNTALLNAPRERQAQIMTNTLYAKNVTKDMTKDEKKKLKSRSLAQARTTVGAKKTVIDITNREWEAIQAKAISNTKLMEILKNSDMDKVRKLATPREAKLNDARISRAKSMLNKGYTLSEVAEALGVSTSTISEEVN